jgi:hypothetical protein
VEVVARHHREHKKILNKKLNSPTFFLDDDTGEWEKSWFGVNKRPTIDKKFTLSVDRSRNGVIRA